MKRLRGSTRTLSRSTKLFQMTNTMGTTNLHTPPSIFQHMMSQQPVSQEPGSWTQMPQVPPISIPWSVPSLQQPELVRFTGGQSLEPVIHQKRKLETPDLLDTRQTKQFITEEKMAAHFKDLHISTKYQPQSPVPSTSTADAQSVLPKELNMELDLDAANAEAEQAKPRYPRLVLSEELKRIQQEPIFPPSLLSKLERPSMALVLWEPPSKHLRILPSRDTPTPIPDAADDNNNNNNNNNEAIPDLNEMFARNASAFEPMEL